MKPTFRQTLIFAFLFLALPLSGVSGQSRSDWREIQVRIAELEGQVEALKENAGRAGSEDLASGQRTLLADMEVRISQLEAEIRRLTGLIEEMAFRQNKIERDLDLLRRDVDLRFQDLSTGEAAEALIPETGLGDGTREEEGTETAALALPEVSLPEGAVEERYQYAFSFLRRGDFGAAEAAFKAFLDAHPTHELAGNAQYWLGETFYVRKDYAEAAAAFLKGFQTYGDGAKGPDSLLKLGMSLGAMDQNEQACSAFEELLSRYGEAGDAILSQAALQQERLGCL